MSRFASGFLRMPTRMLRPVSAALLITLSVMGSGATGATATASAAAPETGPKGVAELSSDEFRVQLRTNALPESAGGTNATAAAEAGMHWDFNWNGWNGLYMGLSQKTPLKSPREMLGLQPLTNAPTFHLEQLKLTGTLGGLVEVDGAAYLATGNMNFSDDVQLRRARLRAQGDCILVFPVSYKIQLGYIPNKFNLDEAWISSERIDYLGYLVMGVYGPPMGLDMLTSSRDLTFMEPATVLQALAPGNEGGIQIGHPVFNEGGTWALGIFGGGLVSTEYGNASQDYGNLIGRVTYLALDQVNPDRPEENRYLHLGLSANAQYSASSTVRYRSRPESYIATYVVDTGVINASGSGTIGAEAAYVNGPFCAQGEFLDSMVRENSGQGLNFYGFYGCASWYLTGESRPYDRVNGQFKRLVPRQNFNFGKGGAWGALEVAARFSYTDLTDGNVNGGKISLLMGELNWYLHSHVRWMFNAGGGHVTGGAYNGDLFVFQTRIGVDF
jgi:phosphate-selective porin OprO and OprP